MIAPPCPTPGGTGHARHTATVRAEGASCRPNIWHAPLRKSSVEAALCRRGTPPWIRDFAPIDFIGFFAQLA